MTKFDSTTLTSIELSVLNVNIFKADMGDFFVFYLTDSPDECGKQYFMEFEPAA